jgi:hypothetical protein
MKTKNLTVICVTIFASLFVLCLTAWIISYNGYTIRFEMDDNTKDAIQSLNWTAINEKNCVCTDFNINQKDCCIQKGDILLHNFTEEQKTALMNYFNRTNKSSYINYSQSQKVIHT